MFRCKRDVIGEGDNLDLEFGTGQDLCDEIDVDKFDFAEYRGRRYLLCEGLEWSGCFAACDCWVHAVPMDAKSKFDHTYKCVLLHFCGDVGQCLEYHAVDKSDTADLFRICEGVGEIYTPE